MQHSLQVVFRPCPGAVGLGDDPDHVVEVGEKIGSDQGNILRDEHVEHFLEGFLVNVPALEHDVPFEGCEFLEHLPTCVIVCSIIVWSTQEGTHMREQVHPQPEGGASLRPTLGSEAPGDPLRASCNLEIFQKVHSMAQDSSGTLGIKGTHLGQGRRLGLEHLLALRAGA
jgi:hypothetical protein